MVLLRDRDFCLMPSGNRGRDSVRGGRGENRKKRAHPKGVTGPALKSNLPLGAQQNLLDVYNRSFHDLLRPGPSRTSLEQTLQRVKGHLYNRDFDAAFGDAESLRAYAARWSPTRALAYQDILNHVSEHFGELKDALQHNVLCLGGGGGAEMLAIFDVLETVCRKTADSVADKPMSHHAAVTVVDIADWSLVLQQLYDSLQSVSSNKKSDNILFQFQSIQSNILEPSAFCGDLLASVTAQTDLVTIFFTLNELFSDSMPRTQTLLMRLTNVMKKDSLLVVVDSAGSYSTVGLGAKKRHEADTADSASSEGQRQYPMAWLLDHVLSKLALGMAPGEDPPWVKLETCESRWFRLSEELEYPIKLEDMRYQLHVFRHT